jgi:hypothetical protein
MSRLCKHCGEPISIVETDQGTQVCDIFCVPVRPDPKGDLFVSAAGYMVRARRTRPQEASSFVREIHVCPEKLPGDARRRAVGSERAVPVGDT